MYFISAKFDSIREKLRQTFGHDGLVWIKRVSLEERPCISVYYIICTAAEYAGATKIERTINPDFIRIRSPCIHAYTYVYVCIQIA